MSSLHSRTALTIAVLLTTAAAAAQQPGVITWTKAPIAGPSDVRTDGKLCVAANLGPETCERVINRTHFQQDRSFWTQKLPSVGATATQSIQYFPSIAAASGGYTLRAPYNRTAGGIGPGHADPAYNVVLKDGRHQSGSVSANPVAIQCAVEGLTPGHRYLIQIWCGNKGRTTRHHEWDNGQGGRAGAGGIYLRSDGSTFGEVATGTFTADATGRQTFTNYHQAADPNANPPILETWGACSAIQVRDLGNPTPRGASVTYYGEGTPGTQDGGSGKRVGGSNCSPGIALTGHPAVSATVNLTIENSSGATNNGMIVLGFTRFGSPLPFLGGGLLVLGTVYLPVVIPFDSTPNRPYTHDHELVIPVTMPNAPTLVYAQVLQIDPGAPQGVSFTPALWIEVGN